MHPTRMLARYQRARRRAAGDLTSSPGGARGHMHRRPLHILHSFTVSFVASPVGPDLVVLVVLKASVSPQRPVRGDRPRAAHRLVVFALSPALWQPHADMPPSASQLSTCSRTGFRPWPCLLQWATHSRNAPRGTRSSYWYPSAYGPTIYPTPCTELYR